MSTLWHTRRSCFGSCTDGYSYVVRHMPALTGWLYDALNRPRERPRLFDRLNTRRFVRMVREYQPEIVVCTHFLPAGILSWAVSCHGLKAALATVLTDFDVHAMWISANCEHYFVAADEARAQLESVGIDGARITVSGIPIDAVFSMPGNKREVRLSMVCRPIGSRFSCQPLVWDVCTSKESFVPCRDCDRRTSSCCAAATTSCGALLRRRLPACRNPEGWTSDGTASCRNSTS